jgi:hypothetical protein
MFSRSFLVLVSVTLISLLVLAWISGRSARVLVAAAGHTSAVQMEGDRLDSRVDAARRIATYGPWAMCLLAVIMLSAMLVHVAATLARAREIRAALH